MDDWTFITNHGAVLVTITKHGKVRAADIALELGLSERTVRRIISNLTAEGYINKKREGKVNQYQLNTELPLRRPGMQDVKIRDLIETISSATGKRRF
ncbi:MAG: MarR family transcriptional regulator [Chloroflexi bacterium]|nr:MarR family transcriptional regulator [Chloroflexota bacterium]